MKQSEKSGKIPLLSENAFSFNNRANSHNKRDYLPFDTTKYTESNKYKTTNEIVNEKNYFSIGIG